MKYSLFFGRPYQGVKDFRHLRVGLTARFFQDAVRDAKAGSLVLWVCDAATQSMWQEKFVQAGCSTNRIDRGIEVGPPDPTI